MPTNRYAATICAPFKFNVRQTVLWWMVNHIDDQHNIAYELHESSCILNFSLSLSLCIIAIRWRLFHDVCVCVCVICWWFLYGNWILKTHLFDRSKMFINWITLVPKLNRLNSLLWISSRLIYVIIGCPKTWFECCYSMQCAASSTLNLIGSMWSSNVICYFAQQMTFGLVIRKLNQPMWKCIHRQCAEQYNGWPLCWNVRKLICPMFEFKCKWT